MRECEGVRRVCEGVRRVWQGVRRGCSVSCLRYVVQRGHECLHHGELSVEAEAEQHREEEHLGSKE